MYGSIGIWIEECVDEVACFHLQLINRDPEIRIGCGCGECQNHSGADIKQHSFFSRVGRVLSLSLSLSLSRLSFMYMLNGDNK